MKATMVADEKERHLSIKELQEQAHFRYIAKSNEKRTNITEVCINVWKLKYIMLSRRVTMVFVEYEKRSKCTAFAVAVDMSACQRASHMRMPENMAHSV